VLLEPGRSVVCPPTGKGRRRGSNTVSEIALTIKKISSPMMGRSPFKVFWL